MGGIFVEKLLQKVGCRRTTLADGPNVSVDGPKRILLPPISFSSSGLGGRVGPRIISHQSHEEGAGDAVHVGR